MSPLVVALSDAVDSARALATSLGAELLASPFRRFPDGETYLCLEASPAGREVIVFGSLDRPDEKIVRLLLLADAARVQGARRVGLVAPYLAYMRQDKQFRPGEAVTSRTIAALLSRYVDWLVTVDPHLHRFRSLDDIYTIPTVVLHAADAVARWIADHVTKPLIVGPDEESAQWVMDVAARAGVPHTVLRKVRRDDRHVEVSLPDAADLTGHTPVLVDDIVSTANTMIETIGHLRALGLQPPVCVGVHAVFAGEAWSDLRAAGPARVVTCNTITHPTNAIDVLPLIATAVRDYLRIG